MTRRLETELEAISLISLSHSFQMENIADSKLSVGVCKKLEKEDTENCEKL